MITFLLDGNNLIGKDINLKKIQQKDKFAVRSKLAFNVENYFRGKNNNVLIFFDGYETEEIKTRQMIIYSGNKTADHFIKLQIDKSVSRKNITLVTSDLNLQEYGKVNSCKIISSEDFLKLISPKNKSYEEEAKEDLNFNVEEYKKLFGLK
jgi:predicted RNA-binding protein with PIN domain